VTCRAPAKAGESCTAAPGCEDPYWCDAGKCVLGSAGLGQACDWLQPGSCAAPNVCPFGTLRCTAPSAIGEPCERKSSYGRSNCVAGAGCNTRGMCAPVQPDGAPCLQDEECTSNVCFGARCGRRSAPTNVILGCGFPV
jgi:hypothetical protein